MSANNKRPKDLFNQMVATLLNELEVWVNDSGDGMILSPTVTAKYERDDVIGSLQNMGLHRITITHIFK